MGTVVVGYHEIEGGVWINYYEANPTGFSGETIWENERRLDSKSNAEWNAIEERRLEISFEHLESEIHVNYSDR